MKRRDFLRNFSAAALTGAMMNLNDLNAMSLMNSATDPMPVIFAGHGNPMNAIEDNEFSQGWQSVGTSISRPAAILCISAHWETKGSFVTAMENPRTIHDFYGFPDKLFAFEYPAPGSPELAGAVRQAMSEAKVKADLSWGLDHGTWSILKHMAPAAQIPVVQLSLDYTLSPMDHLNLAGQLAPFRRRGIVILGSGNIVHNLRMVDWKNQSAGHDWAIEANETIKKIIQSGDFKKLAGYESLGKAVQLAVPTPEHLLPLLYVLALKEEDESVTYFNDRCVMGSLSMTSLKIS